MVADPYHTVTRHAIRTQALSRRAREAPSKRRVADANWQRTNLPSAPSKDR